MPTWQQCRMLYFWKSSQISGRSRDVPGEGRIGAFRRALNSTTKASFADVVSSPRRNGWISGCGLSKGALAFSSSAEGGRCEPGKLSTIFSQWSKHVSNSHHCRRRFASRFGLLVISLAEIFFQPQIEADEQVTAAHFLDFELGHASAAVTPGNRHHRPGISANDGL